MDVKFISSGSDLFFESYNAFIHIDVKTVKSDNEDFRGKKSLLERIKRVTIHPELTVNPTFRSTIP